MTSREDLDEDDDFSEIYKAYTGPSGYNASTVEDKTTTTTKKRSHAGSDEEDEARDPNAVPTDFTSREARVWEAKSKATEKNWKKRKEEEMICKICGESGHFTQGCPSTLGANRKSQDFLERVPAREPHVKALFSVKVVNQIEKDIGCKIKIDEKFIIVSGTDRLILKKGVDAVHKIKEEGEHKEVHKFPEEFEHKSPVSWSRSPVPSRFGRTDSVKSHHHNNTATRPPGYGSRQEKIVEDRVREDLLKLSSGSPHAYGKDGVRVLARRSRSPSRPSYMENTYDGQTHNKGGYKMDAWNTDRYHQSDRQSDYLSFPNTLEEIEFQYKKEALELASIRDKEEDEENYRHREAVKEIRENYMKKVALLKSTHSKVWEEFIQVESQRTQQHILASGFGGYQVFDDKSSGNPHYSAAGIQPMESRGKYQRNEMDSFPSSSRPDETYGNFQRHKRDDFGKAYTNRY